MSIEEWTLLDWIMTRIETIRNREQISRSSMTRIMGISRPTYYRYLYRERMIPIHTLLKFVQHFDLDWSEVLPTRGIR